MKVPIKPNSSKIAVKNLFQMGTYRQTKYGVKIIILKSNTEGIHINAPIRIF